MIETNKNTNLEVLEPRRQLSAVALVQPFSQVDYYGGSADWALNAVNAPEVWDQGFTGDGLVIAVIDSGVDLQHADLVDQIWSNVDEIAGNGIDDDANGFVDDSQGWDFVTDDASPQDAAGHGTQVSGIIAASHNGIGATGIAYNARIMPVRVLDAQGKGSQFDIASGIRYAVNNGADIINLSLGAGSGSQRVRTAIQHALTHDVLIVAASGNAGESTPDYPAAFSNQFSNVISVGAFNNQLDLASFSNRVGDSGAIQIDAPGVGVYSTKLGGGAQQGSGTSFATPIVSGIAALMLSANPELTPTEIRSGLVSYADLIIGGTDSQGGVNAAAAVAAVVPPQPLPPIQVAGDTDADGMVGMSDFLAVSRNFGKQVTSREEGDLNGDGIVEFSDFLILTRNFGQTAATASNLDGATATDQVLASQLDFEADHLNELI